MPPRITDLSSISPETIKKRNEQFWIGEAEYETVRAGRRTREKIWRVRNGDLRKVLRRFPTDAPIQDQCAGWVHAIAGRHFFPDANHRTAIAILRELLRENGITPGKWPVDVSYQASIRSHRVRDEIENVCLDTIYEYDRLFLVWLLYFKNVLRIGGD